MSTATSTTASKTTTWTADPAHSTVGFTVRHMMFAKVHGRFTKWNASVTLDEADLARSKLQASIDAASIDTGVADRDKHLRSADFFDAEKFPELRFESTRIEKLSAERYRVHGKLSMHGATKDIAFEAEVGGRGKDPWGKERIGVSGQTTVQRSDFGLKWNQALEAGGVLVSDDVHIELDVQLVTS
jgi:polyisoprenoid-binding protein YceI